MALGGKIGYSSTSGYEVARAIPLRNKSGPFSTIERTLTLWRQINLLIRVHYRVMHTRAVPRLRKPSLRAAAFDTSITRPRTCGPRSTIFTVTLRPLR